MRKIRIFYFLLLMSVSVFGQDKIELDRPDQTETPFVVPKNFFQFESGFLAEKTAGGEMHYEHPAVLWKYGINGNTEIRLITEISSEAGITKLEPVKLGFKTGILQPQGIIPKTSFIGHLEFAKDDFERRRLVPSFRFVFQNELSEDLNLGYNLGMEWNENLQEDYIYTLTLGKSFSEKFGGFVELYGFLSPFHTGDNRVDGGVTYFVNKDFVLDFSLGVGLSEISSKHFFSFGISHRFDLKNNF